MKVNKMQYCSKNNQYSQVAGSDAKCSSLVSDNAGETVSETLVGLLIVCLAIVMFMTMVNVATTIASSGIDRTAQVAQQVSAIDSMLAGQNVDGASMSDAIVKAEGLGEFHVKLPTANSGSNSFDFAGYEPVAEGDEG